jgi:hypothetical protein
MQLIQPQQAERGL